MSAENSNRRMLALQIEAWKAASEPASPSSRNTRCCQTSKLVQGVASLTWLKAVECSEMRFSSELLSTIRYCS